MNKFVALMLLLTIISCGKKSGGSSAPATKSMFSTWTNSTDSTDVVDFNGYTLGAATQETVTFADGAICDFDSTITGTAASALWTITNGSYRAATGGGDPGCASLNVIHTLAVSGTTMTICDPPGYTTCGTYN